MSTTSPRGRRHGGAGLAALVAGLLLVASVAPAPAQQRDCAQELERIEAQAAGADLTLAQRDYIRDLIDYARTFAENGNVRGCRQTIADLAEYVDEEGIDMPLAREARDRAPDVTLDDLLGPVRVGETPVPLPVPPPEVPPEQAEPEVPPEQAEPEVAIEPANPNVIIERAEPNVTIEQAEPRVTIERMGSAEGGGG